MPQMSGDGGDATVAQDSSTDDPAGTTLWQYLRYLADAHNRAVQQFQEVGSRQFPG